VSYYFFFDIDAQSSLCIYSFSLFKVVNTNTCGVAKYRNYFIDGALLRLYCTSLDTRGCEISGKL